MQNCEVAAASPFKFPCSHGLNRRKKAISTPGQSLDEARTGGGIAQRFTDLVDGRVQASVEFHKGVGRPDLLLKLVPADQLAGILQQLREYQKGLLLQRDLYPLFRNSPASKSTSKTPKRTDRMGCGLFCMEDRCDWERLYPGLLRFMNTHRRQSLPSKQLTCNGLLVDKLSSFS